MTTLETYLQRMRDIHATGRATNETSYYTPLENLLQNIGTRLTPSVVVTSQLSTRGAAIAPRGTGRRSLPDFGFFVQETQDLRGLVEAKGVNESVYEIARQPQIARYLRIIPVVLITTYREFLLVTREADGTVQLGEFYSLADNEHSFWTAPIPNIVATHEAGFRAFLENVLRVSGPIVSAEELALVLSRYAAEARSRIMRQNNRLLDPLRESMSKALGMSFLGPNGETFFRSSLIQTLFYGLFSSWIIWHEKGHDNEQFEWERASSYLNLSVIGGLFEAIATNRRLRELNLADPMRWAEEALNRVDENTFFETFDQHYATSSLIIQLVRYPPKIERRLSDGLDGRAVDNHRTIDP